MGAPGRSDRGYALCVHPTRLSSCLLLFTGAAEGFSIGKHHKEPSLSNPLGIGLNVNDVVFLRQCLGYYRWGKGSLRMVTRCQKADDQALARFSVSVLYVGGKSWQRATHYHHRRHANQQQDAPHTTKRHLLLLLRSSWQPPRGVLRYPENYGAVLKGAHRQNYLNGGTYLSR